VPRSAVLIFVCKIDGAEACGVEVGAAEAGAAEGGAAAAGAGTASAVSAITLRRCARIIIITPERKLLSAVFDFGE